MNERLNAPLSTASEILSFIREFEPVKEFFLAEKSYWFAAILRDRFNGTILYLLGADRFVCMIGENCYDASGYLGDYTDLNCWFYAWNDYPLVSPMDARRVLHDKVYFQKEEDWNVEG